MARESRAQGTVEYALTIIAVLAIVMGCAAVWRVGSRGVFTQGAQTAASHSLEGKGVIDIALY